MRELRLARDLVRTCCCTPRLRLPVDLSAICRHLGCTVRALDIPDYDGCHLRLNGTGRPLILLGTNLHRHRKRFTLAHEIGHIVLGHAPSRFDGEHLIEARARWQESQADRFASELLMPWPAMRQLGMMSVEAISARFCVSPAAAACRAQQVGWTRARTRRAIADDAAAQLDALDL